MTVNDVRNGVTVESGVPVNSQPILEVSRKDAVLASTLSYDDHFARLRVFDENTGSHVTLSSFDGVVQDEPTVVLDYILIRSMSESFIERMSPTYTFGSSVIYSAGSDAKSFTYSAVILNDKVTGDNQARFLKSYDDAIRASELLDPDQPRYVELSYRDQIRRGFITSLSVQRDSASPTKIDLTFTMFVADSFSVEQ